ncbi:cytochrome c-type biogenesis protein [Vibrio gangliei]|uniref:cytochrome c-type biogenesis protein n=1 Tax=Vibrio gangliei TaxID=2077090 RepID=UPI003872E86D
MKKSRLLMLLCLFFAIPAMSAIEVFDFDTPQQEAQFQELSHTLRCPKCQNNSISDSNAELAKDLRMKVYQMTKEDKSKQEIVDYMVARYGNFVTYNPPLTPSTAVLWLAPLAIVVFGFGFIVIRSRKKAAATEGQSSAQWDEKQEQRLKALLDESDSNDKKGNDS